nr:hypothetical protein [Rhodococcus sp. (in: high G+C Gram-positive bacteria)]
MARIGLDMDGVVYNFENSVRTFLVDEWGYNPEELPAPIGWAIDEQWGMSREAFREACHEGVDAGVIFRDGDPYPGTAEGFALLREAGHTIHIVTARTYGKPGMAALNTQEWLDEHGLEYDTITYAHDKTVVATDYMIDDKVENYDDLLRAGTYPMLLNQNWNQDSAGVKRGRVNTLPEFAYFVNALSPDPAFAKVMLEQLQRTSFMQLMQLLPAKLKGL